MTNATLIKNSNNLLVKQFQAALDKIVYKLPLQALEFSCKRFNSILFHPGRVLQICLLVFPHFGSNFAGCISVQRVTGPDDVFPYKEVFHLSACHHQTTVETGKPLGRMPEKLICIARLVNSNFSIWTNTFVKLEKYTLQFGQILFKIWQYILGWMPEKLICIAQCATIFLGFSSLHPTLTYCLCLS